MWGTVSLPTREENLWRAGTRGQPANQERALACSYLSRVNRSSAPHQGSLPGVPRSSTVPGTFEVALKTDSFFGGWGRRTSGVLISLFSGIPRRPGTSHCIKACLIFELRNYGQIKSAES